MFSRRHYVAIAADLAAERDRVTAASMADRFADRFAADNPRFDRARFMDAAGVTADRDRLVRAIVG